MLKEALQQEDTNVSIEKIDESMLAFYIGDTKKLIRLNNGEFPKDNDVIAKDYTQSISLERQVILDIMERIIDKSKEQSPSDWVQKVMSCMSLLQSICKTNNKKQNGRIMS